MIVIVIPAKGASSRLANKNMTVLAGRPMIDHTIDAARASRRAEAIYITTDSEAIAAHAEARGIGATPSRYTTTKNKKTTPQRIELRKYNPFLRRHTIHRELK
jgi:large subunit ribosomal protein L33